MGVDLGQFDSCMSCIDMHYEVFDLIYIYMSI